MKQSFVCLPVLLVLAGCGGSGAGGGGSILPASGTTSAVATQTTSSLSASGAITGLFGGGFVLNTGSPHGDVNIDTSASTKITGPSPYDGESVNVTGTGSWSSSIAAATVAQAASSPQGAATPTPGPTATLVPAPVSTGAPIAIASGIVSTSGTVTGTSGSIFVLNQGAPHGDIDITLTGQTVQIGSAASGEYAQVTGSGSASTAITATIVTYAPSAPGSITVGGTVVAAESYGFMLATSSNKALPVVVTSAALVTGAILEVGSSAVVSGIGTATTSVTASRIAVTDPTPTPVPTSAPTPRPTATPAPVAQQPAPTSPAGIAAAPTFGGCNIFPQGDLVYNSSIAQDPADPDSATYMASFLAAGGNGNVVASGNAGAWPVNVATSSTPSYPLATTSGSVISGIENFPFLSTYGWENKGLNAADDRHLIVINTSTCMLYEGYGDAAEPPAEWQIVNNQLQQPSSYAWEWNLNSPYPASAANGVNAAHVPQFAGMVRWDDIESGCVCHALNIDVMVHSLRSSAYVYPAQSPEGPGYYGGPSADAALALPLGARLRLKSTFVLSCPSGVSDGCAQAKMIVTALQTYGGYVMDTGGFSGSIDLADEPVNGTQTFPWNGGDIEALDSIPMSAFEVVPPPGCLSVESCVK